MKARKGKMAYLLKGKPQMLSGGCIIDEQRSGRLSQQLHSVYEMEATY